MDDRTRRMIEAYLPSPPDTTLEDGEYYYKQETARGPRIIRVFPLDILPHRYGTEYGIYQRKGAQLVRVDTSGYGDPSRGVRFGYLYDNKEDCRDGTHDWVDEWEHLREQEDA